jgi:hypothetical protein
MLLKSFGDRARGERIERMRATMLGHSTVLLLGGGAFLPVHWGTFSLALHEWGQPAETLLRLAPARGVHLLMPQLGQAVEPSRVSRWRGVDARGAAPIEPQSWPKAMPFPLD